MLRLPILPAEVPTASRVGLALHCVYPWTSGQRPSRRTSSVEAGVGSVVHAAAEMAVRGEEGPPDFHTLPPETWERASDLIEVVRGFLEDERSESHAMHAAEVPVELDVLTGAGRVLPSSGQRDYSARSPYGLAGTVDHVFHAEDGRVTVRDWKTGIMFGLAREAARVQLRTLAAAIAAAYDVDEVVTEIAAIETTGVRIERELLTGNDLQEHLEALWSLVERLGSGPQAPAPGPWCVEMHCPLLGDCPASRGALAAVTREEPILQIADDATALRVIDALPRAEAALKAVRDALHDYIRWSPPVAADGRRYGFVEHTVRRLDVSTEERRQALTIVLGEHARAAVDVEYTSSIEAIKRAARRKLAAEKQRRGISALTDQAVNALSEVGGVRVSTYQKPGWVGRGTSSGEGTKDLAMMTGDEYYE